MKLCVAATIINTIELSQTRKWKLYLQRECTVQTIVDEALRKANFGANFVCNKVEINDEDIGELLEVAAKDQVEDKGKYVIHVQPAGLLKDDSFWTYENESVLGGEEKENWDMMSVQSEQVDKNVLESVDYMKLSCISEPGLFRAPLCVSNKHGHREHGGIEVIEDGTSSTCATAIGHNHDESTSELYQDANLSKEVEYRLSLLNNLQSSVELPSSMISSSGMAADTINQPVGQQYESNLVYNDSVHANESSKEDSIFLAKPNM
uniref:Uncharacterized protein n=1 Tax=Ditylenchus dipsaci TaxID=166011 RepID=A0A915E6U5_9BILA